MAHAESLKAAFAGVAQALRRLQEAMHEHMQKAVRETVRAELAVMEERLARVEATHSASAERSGGQDYALVELKGQVRQLEAKMEERLAKVEATHSASAERSGGQDHALVELEGRVRQLEAKMEERLAGVEATHSVSAERGGEQDVAVGEPEGSVPSALGGVFPRVDAQLHQLEFRSPPALNPTSSSSCPPPSALPPEAATSTPSTPAASTPRLISKQLKNLNKKLSEAAKEGRVDDVRRFLDEGADINNRGIEKWTPLHWAAVKGHRNVVSLLLERGADVNATDGRDRTPLHWSFGSERSVRIVQLLISSGADVNRKSNNGWTPLYFAVYYGREDSVRALIAAGARKDIKNSSGKMLYEMCSSESLRMLLVP